MAEAAVVYCAACGLHQAGAGRLGRVARANEALTPVAAGNAGRTDMSIVLPKLEKGEEALKRGSAGWKNFAVVTTHSPWSLAQSRMPQPAQVVFIDSLERKDLNKLTEQLRGLDLLVGLGSGRAMDAAKFLAKVTGIKLAQVLSTSSNNACFTRTAWTFEKGARIPERETPIPQQLILDFDLLRQAPPVVRDLYQKLGHVLIVNNPGLITRSGYPFLPKSSIQKC